jgi:hypothetical protein
MRRPRTTLFLFLCGIALLVSIYVGERMGEHVLSKTTQPTPVIPEVTTPSPAATLAASAGPIVDWRRLQVVTVATDPGFPDPRVTKPPTPTPKPTRTPTPVPTLTAGPAASGSAVPPYALPTPTALQAPPAPGGG